MYRITEAVDGAEIGVTETVSYIKIDSSGSSVAAIKSDVIGITFDSTPCNPVGYDEIEGTETAVVSEVGGGTTVSHRQPAINEMTQTILEG